MRFRTALQHQTTSTKAHGNPWTWPMNTTSRWFDHKLTITKLDDNEIDKLVDDNVRTRRLRFERPS